MVHLRLSRALRRMIIYRPSTRSTRMSTDLMHAGTLTCWVWNVVPTTRTLWGHVMSRRRCCLWRPTRQPKTSGPFRLATTVPSAPSNRWMAMLVFLWQKRRRLRLITIARMGACDIDNCHSAIETLPTCIDVPGPRADTLIWSHGILWRGCTISIKKAYHPHHQCHDGHTVIN